MAGFFSSLLGGNSTPTPAPVAATPAPTPVPAPAPVAPTVPESPLDQFAGLWEPTKTEGVDGTLPANIFAGVDPKQMLAAARKVDFAKSIPPEVLAKVTAGGPEAQAAFVQMLNDVSQRAYAQSSLASTQIVQQALAKFQEGLDARLPSQIKRHAVSDTLREANPALSHPAAAPIMEAMQSQLAVKYPNATVAEIRDLATQYLSAFSKTALPAPKAPAIPASEDWEKFLTS